MSIERLIEQSDALVDRVETAYVRDMMGVLEGNRKLMGIKGSRGVGKTTLMLQFLRQHPELKALYVSMDDLYFADRKLFDLASDLSKRGWNWLMVDEVHLYPDWSQEIKLIYDRLPGMNVVFTGSSLISVDRGKGDLSRRARMHTLYGLSFREYLKLKHDFDYPAIELNDLLKDHREITRGIREKIRPLEFFDAYLRTGYYPFFMEDPGFYLQKLKQTAQIVIDFDLVHIYNVEIRNLGRLKQLLGIIADAVPFVPNIHKLSERMQLDRNSLKLYLGYLHEAMLIHNLYSAQKGIGRLTKPEKIYLQNPNLFYALSTFNPNPGSIRESFVLSHLAPRYVVDYPGKGDFLIEKEITFEVGGANKKSQQIKDVEKSYLIKDNIETGYGREIPLWVIGFLY